ncbi:helix-turn-helix domain-containing protein [Gluconacetobacter sp. 1b LMG 1731]|uniref:Helix-turn-helix domain-containing protein n=1 Tax=Gluconacetobacter dulcium TaxID=2729096 RepID=A0A7W4NSL4_9PROT|nr:helix-turn-helix domain-containing protein [Gluconacetobacter dulcium]MBB2164637.1 helix-turn-helix domain-containing protein [Gluconacetobacter dulcium]MBB2193773.1 helix-turn-helix domain-containing protein [Gluconacetobacter dulcium]
MASKEEHSRRLPAVMDSKQAAEYLGLSYGRLRNLLWLGLGPKSFSFGKRDRRFRVSDLDAFIAAKVGDVAPATAVKRSPGRPRKGRTSIAAVIAVSVLAVALVVAWIIIAASMH